MWNLQVGSRHMYGFGPPAVDELEALEVVDALAGSSGRKVVLVLWVHGELLVELLRMLGATGLFIFRRLLLCTVVAWLPSLLASKRLRPVNLIRSRGVFSSEESGEKSSIGFGVSLGVVGVLDAPTADLFDALTTRIC